jgi:hypothetical protein
MHAFLSLSLAAFLMFALASCDKSSTSIDPVFDQQNHAMIGNSQTDIDVVPASGGEVELFQAKGDFEILVNRASGGSGFNNAGKYLLTAEGISVSPIFGEAQTSLELYVNLETATAEGTITYDFKGDIYSWKLSGALDKTPNAEYSALSAKLMTNGSPSGFNPDQTGRATTFLYGDIYYLIQRAGAFESTIFTNGYVIM